MPHPRLWGMDLPAVSKRMAEAGRLGSPSSQPAELSRLPQIPQAAILCRLAKQMTEEADPNIPTPYSPLLGLLHAPHHIQNALQRQQTSRKH